MTNTFILLLSTLANGLVVLSKMKTPIFFRLYQKSEKVKEAGEPYLQWELELVSFCQGFGFQLFNGHKVQGFSVGGLEDDWWGYPYGIRAGGMVTI